MTETYTTTELIDLVNRLRKENEELKIELMAMRGAANSFKPEVERLKRANNDLAKEIYTSTRIWRHLQPCKRNGR